jgi:hypothetical protein
MSKISGETKGKQTIRRNFQIYHAHRYANSNSVKCNALGIVCGSLRVKAS